MRTLSRPLLLSACGALLWSGCLAGCGRFRPARVNYQMGEKVPLGSLTYNIIETTWLTQLGNGFRVRTPQQRFLLISLSVSNGGGSDLSVPPLSLENYEGQSFLEERGEDVENWIGLLRTISPAQTLEGKI